MSKAIFKATALALGIFGAVNAMAAEVELIQDGEWIDNHNPQHMSWLWDENVWVDIKIENIAFNKRVGIVWTVDGWETNNVAVASYEQALSGNFEQWGVDVTPAKTMSDCFWCEPDDVIFEYAIFFEDQDNNVTYWDNNLGDNYQIVFEGSLSE